MSYKRIIMFVVALGMAFALVGVPTQSQTPVFAAGESWHILNRIASGCGNGETYFAVSFDNLVTGTTYYADTIVKDNNGIVYMDEYFAAAAPGPFDNDWGVFDANYRGLQTGSFPLPAGEQLTITVTLRDANEQVLSVDYVQFTCDAGDIRFSAVPGCDVLLPIPANAVGGAFVTDAPVYAEPGVITEPVVTIPAGNTARVIGLDSTGQYYKIIWVCDYLWVPVSTMGPAYGDQVWQGAALPGNAVN